MAFEIFTRKVIRRGSPAVTATKLGRMAINKIATANFEKQAVEFVLVLWDAESRKIGIRPISKKDPRSYKLSYGDNGNGAGFSAKTFFDYISFDYSASRVLTATWDEEQQMLVVDVPEEFIKPAQQATLVEMGTTRRMAAN